MRKPPPAKPGEVNYPMFDRFTFVHFGIGLVYGLFMPFVLAVFLAVGWELIENPVKVAFPRIFPHGTADTIQNMVGDVLAVVFGWAVTGLTIAR